jgi:hypothetical protein
MAQGETKCLASRQVCPLLSSGPREASQTPGRINVCHVWDPDGGLQDLIRKLRSLAAPFDGCGSAECFLKIFRAIQTESKTMARMDWFGSSMLSHVRVAYFPHSDLGPWVVRNNAHASRGAETLASACSVLFPGSIVLSRGLG